MSTQFRVAKDIAGKTGRSDLFSDTIFNATMVASFAESITVPGGAPIGGMGSLTKMQYKAEFTYIPANTSPVWVALNQAAAIPGGAAFVPSVSELNPVSKIVSEGDVIHLITSVSDTNVSVALYAILGD